MNDTYGTCFNCWEIYKGMRRILGADEPTSKLALIRTDALLAQYELSLSNQEDA